MEFLIIIYEFSTYILLLLHSENRSLGNDEPRSGNAACYIYLVYLFRLDFCEGKRLEWNHHMSKT